MSILDLLARRDVTTNQKASSVHQHIATTYISDFVSSYFTMPAEERINYINQFQESLWVYICVYAIATSGASVPVKIYRKKSKGLKRSTLKYLKEKHKIAINSDWEYYINNKTLIDLPLNLLKSVEAIEEETNGDLFYLFNNINPISTKYDFWESIFAFLELRGNSFVELVGEKQEPVSINNPPIELWILNPDKITIVPGKTEFIQGYLYDAGGRYIPIPKENIWYSKQFNPKDDYYGQSTLEALKDTVLASKNATKYNANFFKYGAKPSGILERETEASDALIKRLRKEFESIYTGVNRMHRPMLLEGGWQWKDVGLSQRDSEFIESRKMDRQDFLAAFGVPPVVAGLETQNYSTAKIQQELYWTTTIQPKWTRLIENLNSNLIPLFGDDLFAKVDYSDIPAMQIIREEDRALVKDLFNIGMITQNEGRQMFGFNNIGSQGDIYYLPANLIPIGEVGKEPKNKEKLFDNEEGLILE